jgi:parallel beta-helix repeat protein
LVSTVAPTLDNTISNVSFPANAAIVATGNRGNLYRGNIITNTSSTSDNGTRGMWIGNTGDSQTEWNPTITTNILNNIGATGIVGHAVEASITGNTVTNTKGAGIKVVPPRGKGGTIVILGNTLRGNTFSGVQVENADSPVLIIGNVMDGNAISGVYSSGGTFTNALISGNKMTNNREAGIFLYNAEGVKIEGNDISGSNHGVLFEAQPGQNIHDVLIIGNTIHDQRWDGILSGAEADK